MIFDKIENADRYPVLKKIRLSNVVNYQKGKFNIDADNFFGIGLEYSTKDETSCLWEAHQKFADIHYILEGEEIVNVAEKQKMKPTMEFDYENDYQLFEGKKEQSLVLREGDFLVLYPNECHQTGVKVIETIFVKKIVFKIKLPL